MNQIKYDLRFQRLPCIGLSLKILFFLLRTPILNRFGIQILIKKKLSLNSSIAFGNKFKCQAGLLKVGENSSLNDTTFIDYAPIYIGKNVGFSNNNILITSTHDIENFNIVIAKPIIIGDNVWITSNVIILGGVTIGKNSIIGAGSVVIKDIPEGVLAAGNPCRVIKKIDFKKGD